MTNNSKFFVVVALIVAAVSFASCGKKDKDDAKSNVCEIETFTVLGNEWVISSGAGTEASPILISPKPEHVSAGKSNQAGSLAPVIVLKHTGATVSPASGTPQDFSGGKMVPYTVTAEDGVTKKVYNVVAQPL